MDLILKATVIGIIEGITEFLPVSSTGHLIIAGDILNFEGSFAVLFEVFIQLGAILAVIYFYRKKITNSLTELKPGQPGFSLWANILIAFLPSAVLGYLLKDFIQQRLFNTIIVSAALVFGAVLMLAVERWRSTPRINTMEGITYKHALLIGAAQCMAFSAGNVAVGFNDYWWIVGRAVAFCCGRIFILSSYPNNAGSFLSFIAGRYIGFVAGGVGCACCRLHRLLYSGVVRGQEVY